jgi:hypothetical protein
MFPDPWLPPLSIHLYGFGFSVGSDLDALTAKIKPLFSANASPEVISISQTNYAGRVGPISALSIGIWSTQSPSPEGQAARRRGLLAVRSTNQGEGAAEILIAAELIRQNILGGIPPTVPANGFTGHLRSKDATATSPADFLVSVAYDIDIPLLGLTSNCTSMVTFRAAGGRVRIDSSPVQCGDHGIFDAVIKNLFTPGAFEVGLTSVLYFAYNAISHPGGGSPAAGAGAPPVGSGLFPSEILAGPLKFSFTYGAPAFILGLGGGNFRFPFSWTQALRMPSLSLRGPATVVLRRDDPTRFEAVPVDMVAPSFQWFLDDQPVPGDAVAMIDLMEPGPRAGTRKHKVRVQAVEPPSSYATKPVSVAAELLVTTKLAPGPVHRYEP